MKNAKRLLSLLLCLVMVVGILPAQLLASYANAAEGETTYILAGSDFQPTDSNTATGVELMSAILDQVQQKYTSFDGFLFGGDYSYGYEEADCIDGKNAVQSTVQQYYGTGMHEVYIQGNHDPDSMVGSTLNASGANDPASGKYGVFVINEQDYMWYNNDQATIQATAANLDSYLDDKYADGFDAPIFVVSHLPLHYSLRTQVGGGDGKYAKYLFDVLQEAGEKGLNIIFLYGHNHSHGWDDYLGGHSVYLGVGDNINIANEGSTTNYTANELKFTYMNAGFVSYYRSENDCDCYSASETTDQVGLTMTVFAITDNQVTVERFDASGEHNMKCAGVLNKSHWSSGQVGSCCSSLGTETYAADTSVVADGFIELNQLTGVPSVSSGDITVKGDGLAALTVGSADSSYDIATNTHTAVYTDINPTLEDGSTYSGEATVRISLPAAFAIASAGQLEVTGGELVSVNDGLLTLTVSQWPADITVTYDANAAAEDIYTLVTDVSELESGEQYLIIYTGDNRLVRLETGTGSGTDGREGLLLTSGGLTGLPKDTVTVSAGTYAAYEWTFTATGDQWYIGDGTQNAAFYTDSSGRFAIALQATGTALTLTDNGDTFGFSGSYNGTKYFNYNGTGDFINGYASNPSEFYIYRKSETTTESLLNNTWQQITAAASGETTYVLVENGTITDGKYLIVNTGSDGSGYAMTAEYDRTAVVIENGVISSVDSSAVFTLNVSGSTVSIRGTNSNYVYPTAVRTWSWTYSLSESSSEIFLDWTTSDTAFRFSNDVTSGNRSTTSYLRYSSSAFSTTGTANQSNLYLYAEVAGVPSDALYAKLENTYVYEGETGMDEAELWESLKSNLVIYTSENADGSGAALLTDKSEVTFDISTIDTSVAGTTVLNVYYKGVVIGKTAVVLADKRAESIKLDPMEGTLIIGQDTVTGAVITVTYDDGSTKTVDLKAAYLSGTNLNLGREGTYTGLTVTYGGRVIEGYTLHVVDSRPDFPNYPNPGAVTLDKIATGMDFQETGLTRVELITSGLPAAKGVDVVVVVDTSSSMDDIVEGVTESRMEVLYASLLNMLVQFQQTNAVTGEAPDIDLAVISFNGYDNQIDGATLDGTYRKNADNSKIFTGENANSLISGVTLGAADFVNTQSAAYDAQTIAGYLQPTESNDPTYSGTNYDAAMANAYNLLSAKKAHNESNGTAREQYMVFLSDGAPFRYNGFNQAADSSTDAYTEWNQWLQGTWADAGDIPADYQGDDYYHFYNGNGTTHPHRIAEAIKGDPNETYYVVDPRNAAGDDGQGAYMSAWAGLGAKIYSIGFCLEADKGVSKETEQELIEVISSGAGYAFPDITDEDSLKDAFNQIVGSISYAASNALFEDQMGDYFDLQIAPVTGYDNSITVTTHKVWTRADLNKGLCAAEDVGKVREDVDAVVVETVTFTVDTAGNIVATSNLINGNIYDETTGLITASTFIYNDSAVTRTVTVNGEPYALPGEAFVWNIGIINEAQYTLSYVVYLTNSMGENGGREGGSYATNHHATLTYSNYKDKVVSQSVASPTMAWKSANVSYAFYLVDANGNPLLADGTRADNFGQAYKVTQPVVYKEMNLNIDAETILAADAKDVLPDGFDLYDQDASYTIKITSDGVGSSWNIISGMTTYTTYVTGYTSGGAYSNALSMVDDSVDYSHTTVYFAVVWVPGTVPDAVVVDYGLPVDISILANDMLGAGGQLVGVGAALASDEAYDGYHVTATTTATSYQGLYGTLTVNAAAGTVRYTPGTMSMPGKEVFTYEAKDADGNYYYGKLTVIPATSIYYEDSFLEFKTYDNYSFEEITSTWTLPGSTTATQGQDRPGTYHLPTVDANNVYGFDGAYTNMATFSLGAAAKIVVDDNSYGVASFSFTGTGFDIISMTSSDTGFIMIDLFTGSGEDKTYLSTYTVDTYYGYTYQDGQWVVANGQDALYQVPVMKVEALPYGTYTVEIVAAYNEWLDHKTDDASYEFYLDAIRIYDPANDGANGPDGEIDQDIRDAYLDDDECWPSYMELRNHLIDAGTFAQDNKASGIVYIDGKDAAELEDYTSYGPNNELYLKPGAAVAFKIDPAMLENIANVQLSVKSADGKEVIARLYNVAVVGKSSVIVNDSSKSFTTATEMYYSCKTQLTVKDTDEVSYIIVLQNAEESEGILSVTNLKFTYTQEPVAAQPALAMMSLDDWSLAVASLSLTYAAPEVTLPDDDVAADSPETEDKVEDKTEAEDKVEDKTETDNSDTVGQPDTEDKADTENKTEEDDAVQQPAEDNTDSNEPAGDNADSDNAPAEDADNDQAPAEDNADSDKPAADNNAGEAEPDNTMLIVAIAAACIAAIAAIVVLVKKIKGGR